MAMPPSPGDRQSSATPKRVPASETSRWLDLYEFYTDFSQAIFKRYQAQGRVFRMAPFRDIVLMLGAEANQFLLVTHSKMFSAELAWKENIGVLFKGGLLNHDGHDHRQLRRLLMPAFRQEALAAYLVQAEPLIDQHLRRWTPQCPDIYSHLKELTLQIAIKVFFGIELEAELAIYNRHITAMVAGSISFVKAPIIGRTYRQALKSRQALVRMLLPLVGERRRRPTADMMGQLCQSTGEDGQMLSDDDIIDQILFIMMAAHDTTASTLSSLVYELSKNPDWQTKLRQEAAEIDAGHLALPDLPDQLILHQYVIKETLRLNTPLKVIPRVSLEDFIFDDFSIPAGQLISICPAFCHYMSEYWTEPERFDPLRFSPERAEHKVHPYAYTPFGGGIHMCLGQFFAEKFVTVILYKMLARFSWQLPPGQDIRFQQVPIQRPKGKMPLHLSLRP